MWITQDEDGWLKIHYHYPSKTSDIWHSSSGEITKLGKPNKNWEDSLINLDTHDYEIKDGILMKLDKAKKPTPRKHAELACKYFMDDTIKVQVKYDDDEEWGDCNYPEFSDNYEYREKPKTKTVRFRNYLTISGLVAAADSEVKERSQFFKEWIGDWQEVTIND